MVYLQPVVPASAQERRIRLDRGSGVYAYLPSGNGYESLEIPLGALEHRFSVVGEADRIFHHSLRKGVEAVKLDYLTRSGHLQPVVRKAACSPDQQFRNLFRAHASRPETVQQGPVAVVGVIDEDLHRCRDVSVGCRDFGFSRSLGGHEPRVHGDDRLVRRCPLERQLVRHGRIRAGCELHLFSDLHGQGLSVQLYGFGPVALRLQLFFAAAGHERGAADEYAGQFDEILHLSV